MSESVILCEGYHDRAFWKGWLTHLRCSDPGEPPPGSSRRRDIFDPWNTRVVGVSTLTCRRQAISFASSHAMATRVKSWRWRKTD
jgi:hypothetical protein